MPRGTGRLRAAMARARYQIGDLWIMLHNALVPVAQAPVRSDLLEVREIGERALVPTDISDHLLTLFHESMELQPGLIVELGVRGGESTFVFERVARLCGAHLISVDIEDCLSASHYPEWIFVQRDDVRFADEFVDFCLERGIDPQIDVLFIDTSHQYEHTCEEIRLWFPHLAPRCKVFFHDTNLRPIGRRRDGRLVRGMDNQRNVVRAIEQHLGCVLEETRDFERVCGEWYIKHHACCHGLTVLRRL